MDRNHDQRKRYRSLKTKIEEWHLKCILVIDLKKVLHYKWEILKLKKKHLYLPEKAKKGIESVNERLTKLIFDLENQIQDTMKELRDVSGKWCFDENYPQPSKRVFDDMKSIDSKCEGLMSKITGEFNLQIIDMVHALRKSVKDVPNVKIIPYEKQDIIFQNPDLAKYNRMAKVEWKARNAFLMGEICSLIKK